MKYSFGEVVGALLGLIATLAITYMAVVKGSDQALGALIPIISITASYFLRTSKVQTPPKE